MSAFGDLIPSSSKSPAIEGPMLGRSVNFLSRSRLTLVGFIARLGLGTSSVSAPQFSELLKCIFPYSLPPFFAIDSIELSGPHDV